MVPRNIWWSRKYAGCLILEARRCIVYFVGTVEISTVWFYFDAGSPFDTTLNTYSFSPFIVSVWARSKDVRSVASFPTNLCRKLSRCFAVIMKYFLTRLYLFQGNVYFFYSISINILFLLLKSILISYLRSDEILLFDDNYFFKYK